MVSDSEEEQRKPKGYDYQHCKDMTADMHTTLKKMRKHTCFAVDKNRYMMEIHYYRNFTWHMIAGEIIHFVDILNRQFPTSLQNKETVSKDNEDALESTSRFMLGRFKAWQKRDVTTLGLFYTLLLDLLKQNGVDIDELVKH